MSLKWNSSTSDRKTENEITLQLQETTINTAKRKAAVANISGKTKEQILKKAIAEGLDQVI